MHSASVGLFVATTFTASGLLFVIQPLFAKMALPHFGGSASVWNTCMLFFQAVLLLAYLYAHLSVKWLGPRLQSILHTVLLIAVLAVLPVAVRADLPLQGGDPTWALLETMALTVGLPFFALATMAPLLQRWFATLPHQSAGDPYFLYSASNLGSLLALVAFPLALEPASGVQSQSSGWTAGYLVLVFLASICVAVVRRQGKDGVSREIQRAAVSNVSLLRRSWWVLVAFVPSSLMLGVTTHISTDLAAVPLLWVVPLALYLVTFILAFSSRGALLYDFAARSLPLLALLALGSIVFRLSSPYVMGIHLAALFACGMVCHGRLARDRPPADRLTEFYLWLSLGGVLGGVFNTLVAPAIFDGVHEYPLMLALACWLKPQHSGRSEPWGLFVVTFFSPFAVYGALWLAGSSPTAKFQNGAVIILLVVGVFWAFFKRSTPFNMVASGLAVVIAGGVGGLPGSVLFADRSFYGILRVIEGPEPGRHVLQHGTTLHGQQDVRVAGSCEPLSYYHRNGPVGELFAQPGMTVRSATVIGLGTGALACYSQPGQAMTFFEIDPAIERVARDPRLFTYLQNSRGDVRVRIGDGRRLMMDVVDGSQDVILVDAFSSDSVPVHLMTREALNLYASKLSSSGVLAFHISNRYLDLESVLAATVAAEGLFGIVDRDTVIPGEDATAGRSPTHWVLMSKEPSRLTTMVGHSGWRLLSDRPEASAWSDDYSNVLEALLAGNWGQ